jgi:hypothetical protein
MAEVTVFVDDAVRGMLPDVCARDGIPTADRLTSSVTVGDGARLGVLWLLVLAGPIGWIALVFIASSRSGGAEVLQVDLPLSQAAWERQQGARSARRKALFFAVTGVGVLMLGASSQAVYDAVILGCGLVLLLGGLIASVAFDLRASQDAVRVQLDASRRWVHLWNVHPRFVEACQAQPQHHRV